MSEPIAVEFEGVGKMYRLYQSRLESFLDMTSLGRIAPWWNPKIENFWALRNVSFMLKTGSRLGIIGRNGAGKTTLLKLMTGNVMPTEGEIKVNGEVQALLEAGAGFHPEFSGYENIEASLIQNGLSRSEIKAAIDEIADFTELGEFLRQPFKTYSAGMQARLVFTTATTIKPDILIIDEILGAGDAYFAVKSRGRMKQLVEGGASILLVSHALDQIIQFCDEAIWLERGRIVLRGSSLEVVKAYEEFVHALQDRQLRAANRQRKLGFRDAVEIGHFSETFILAISLSGPPGLTADFSQVDLRAGDVAEETVRIGDPQDSDQTHFAYVAMNTGNWSELQVEEGGGHFRSVAIRANGNANALGEMVFRSYSLEPGKPYAFRIRYRLRGGESTLAATVSRNGEAIVINAAMPTDGGDWREFDLMLPIGLADEVIAPTSEAIPETAETIPETSEKDELPTSPHELQLAADDLAADRGLTSSNLTPPDLAPPVSAIDLPPSTGASDLAIAEASAVAIPSAPASCNENAAVEHNQALAPDEAEKEQAKSSIRRWVGEGSLLIDDVDLLDENERERAVFRVGTPLVVCMHYHATRKGRFSVICTVAMFRVDGVKITQHVSQCEMIEMEAQERRTARLNFPVMDLADGRYVISVALHQTLDPYFPDETIRYDLLDRSFEFEIVGNPPLRTSLFVLPAEWKT